MTELTLAVYDAAHQLGYAMARAGMFRPFTRNDGESGIALDAALSDGFASFTPEAEAARIEAVAASEWQPIATVPRDETEILVCWQDSQDMAVVYYDPYPESPDHVWHVSDGPTFHRDAFTHWMPLPAPPPVA